VLIVDFENLKIFENLSYLKPKGKTLKIIDI